MPPGIPFDDGDDDDDGDGDGDNGDGDDDDEGDGGADSLVDSIVWVKHDGESDGKCGMKVAPAAGEFFLKYAMQLVRNADPRIFTAPSDT